MIRVLQRLSGCGSIGQHNAAHLVFEGNPQPVFYARIHEIGERKHIGRNRTGTGDDNIGVIAPHVGAADFKLLGANSLQQPSGGVAGGIFEKRTPRMRRKLPAPRA